MVESVISRVPGRAFVAPNTWDGRSCDSPPSPGVRLRIETRPGRPIRNHDGRIRLRPPMAVCGVRASFRSCPTNAR
jgi:hypothetical protein